MSEATSLRGGGASECAVKDKTQLLWEESQIPNLVEAVTLILISLFEWGERRLSWCGDGHESIFQESRYVWNAQWLVIGGILHRHILVFSFIYSNGGETLIKFSKVEASFYQNFIFSRCTVTASMISWAKCIYICILCFMAKCCFYYKNRLNYHYGDNCALVLF